MKTKKNEAVAVAEAAFAAAGEAVVAATAELDRLKGAHADAGQALLQARLAADADLPSCRMVKVRRFGRRAEEDFGRAVIVRQTPAGMLVVRLEGDMDERRFKASKFSNVFRQVEKAGWSSDWFELRDVPAEYLPKAEA